MTDWKSELSEYVEFGKPVGAFLEGILANDLYQAVLAAPTDEDRMAIPEIVMFVYWELPHGCRGSRDKVLRWIRKKQGRGNDRKELGMGVEDPTN